MRPRRARLGWYGHRGDSLLARLPASMRPRRARLGWRRSPPSLYDARMSFNEAEARTPRMARAKIEAKLPVIPASMRPRRARLGWPIDPVAGAATLAPLQ